MADGYWMYADSRLAPAVAPPPTAAVSFKRHRPDYPDIPVGPEMHGYGPRGEERAVHLSVRDTETINASYDRYLRNGVSSFGPAESIRHVPGGMTGRPGDDPRLVGFGGIGSGRPESALPPDASKTIFVEGLPSNCSRREVSHIFRPFVGFREVRLVNKESRQAGGDPLVLCFVDFTTPSQAAIALEALQVAYLHEPTLGLELLGCTCLQQRKVCIPVLLGDTFPSNWELQIRHACLKVMPSTKSYMEFYNG